MVKWSNGLLLIGFFWFSDFLILELRPDKSLKATKDSKGICVFVEYDGVLHVANSKKIL